MDPVKSLPGGDWQDERRSASRRKVKLKKIFAAEVGLAGETQNCFVHIHDLSESGMRVHTDVKFPPGVNVPIKLFLDEPLDLVVAHAWSKELIGGMEVVGLEFVDIAAREAERIRNFLGRHSPENKRTSLRLQRILVVEMLLGSTSQKFGVFTLDISTQGMRIVHEFPLPEDIEIPFRILLEYDKPPIAVTGKVSWTEENTFGQYMIGLEFLNPDPTVQTRIENFIDAQIRGEIGDSQTFATINDFSQW